MDTGMGSVNKLIKKVKAFLIYIILICITCVFLFPVLYMVTNSFMSGQEVRQSYKAVNGVADDVYQGGEDSGTPGDAVKDYMGFKLVPEEVSFMQYYNVLLRKPKFLIMFWNSLIVTVPILAGQVIVSMLAAYAFSKLKFPFSDLIFFIYIIVMMMPFQVTLVPNYIILKTMNLTGSYWSIILPGIFSTFGVFLLRQFMRYVPDDYFQAARIDGAGYTRSFFSVMLPQCKGAVASLAILVFIDNWNMVEQPLIFLDNENMHPLSIFLSRINEMDLGIAFACGMLYMIPALLVFLYGENYLVEGIELSGIK